MPSLDHSHPVDASSVAEASAAVLSPEDGDRLGTLLGLLSDATRLRMLFGLLAVEELCVGDLALALDISLDQSSYGLKQLRSAGLVESRRDGRVLYYRLADGFPHQLLEHCLHELLTISRKGTR